MSKTTRRGFFGILAGTAAAAATGWRRLGARRLDPNQVGINVKSWVENGRTIWEFAHFAHRDGERPVSAGERVYFDGSPYGAPVIDGVVARCEDEVSPGGAPRYCMQSVRVESDADPA